MESNYDLVVIGSGPGGYVAAIRAGQLGLKTAIIEKEELGGVCLNWGCIPSKSLLKNAEIVSYFKRADEFGLKMDNFHADYSVAIDRSRKVVDRNTKGVAFLLDKNKVDHIRGTAKIVGAGKVEIAPDGNVLEAKNIIIATGARPRSIPPLPIDGEKIITSRESIVLSDLPSSIVIVGGGAIGVEFAYIYKMYGVQVTIVEMLPRLVPSEDEDISAQLERAFKRHRIDFLTGAGVTGVDTSGAGVTVTVDKDGAAQTLECDKVLVAIGVQPNVEDLGLETVGIATGRIGIVVDEKMATNVAGIYAIGDVNGKLPLAHVASAQAVVAVENIAGLETQPLDYAYMPRATYCMPQIASFGLTEAQAREQGKEIKIGTFNVQANGKALAMGEDAGLIKLVVDAKHGELLGGHLIGPEVTELLGELSMTRLLEGTVLELGWAVHAHPSLSEMLKEAALSAQGRAIHM
ncbi:MAG: dihydrolipoyl dehydrogenase [Chloroflexi bacterium]|nr:dihydrolipoyl dehydrogenase [Chloroflexota bacterium]MCI0788590.1 dihydrolipoyl dehydrogenase [Chloroflexota bacterium]MCI0801528.1 dihydrolipoyl dehydrogenase [Chloroflexota bacterium]MCI0810759.1 dihydrolipoyl dehydrogenase [Chloroflexota bacterium]MCI0830335.1 dihydrolipoyl dehydrogenase [Chloroflexota bacterium]